jgi:thymidylate synthase
MFDLGPVYGKQWRHWDASAGKVIDQLAGVIQKIHNDPQSRSILLSAWNPVEIDDMALPPCHVIYQFRVNPDRTLDLCIFQRSCDVFLGLPFNIANGAFFLHIIASITGYTPGTLVWQGSDVHIYKDHYAVMQEQITREPLKLPTLSMPTIFRLHGITIDGFSLNGYESHPHLMGKMFVDGSYKEQGT